MSICVIFNPAAARGSSARRLRQVRRLLGRDAEFQQTRACGHAEELAFAAAQANVATIVAAGGDGTVHEVANGVLRSGKTDTSFGVIPLGSGNDYASALALPAGVAELCALVRSPNTRRVDVGLVRDETGRSRYFVNTLGMGLSGAVSWESLGIKRLRGMALYGVAALRAIWKHFHAVDSVLTIDAERCAWPILYFAVALGQREGGSFIVAPEARIDDGLFDYLHAGRVTRLQALRYLPRLIRGRVAADDPLLHRGQCRRVEIETSQSLPVHLDGEMFIRPGAAVRRVEVEILPAALQVRCP